MGDGGGVFCGSCVADVESEVCEGVLDDDDGNGDDVDVDVEANVVARVASKFPSAH